MKRWLAALAPWMVAAAATSAHAQSSIRPVAVDYTYHGLHNDNAYLVDDECWGAPVMLRKWGWEVELRLNDADIEAEGRKLRLPHRVIKGRQMVSLNEAARQLGALSSWDDNKNVYRIKSWVRNIEVTREGVRLDATLAVQPQAFRLDNPDRLVVDFKGAEYKPDRPFSLPSGWRVGQVNENTFRFVVEHPEMARQPLPDVKSGRTFAFALRSINAQAAGTANPNTQPTVPANPNQAVIAAAQIVQETGSEVLLRVPIQSGKAGAPIARFDGSNIIVVTIPNARPEQQLKTETTDSKFVKSYALSSGANNSTVVRIEFRRPMAFQVSGTDREVSVRTFKPTVSDGKLAGKIIAVDAGHGGRDPGASTGQYREKDYTLSISRMLARALIDQGASVIMTRNDDRYVGLTDRSDIANRSQADLFLSIHVNSNTVANSRSGTMTFYHKKSATGMLLAECIQNELVEVTTLPDLGIVSDSVIYDSGFAVLRNTTMPGVLVELGFINHSKDRAALSKADIQDKIAKAIARGVKVYVEGVTTQ